MKCYRAQLYYTAAQGAPYLVETKLCSKFKEIDTTAVIKQFDLNIKSNHLTALTVIYIINIGLDFTITELYRYTLHGNRIIS